jgi:uncharacterized membrane protein
VPIADRVVWVLTAAVVALEVPYPLVHGHARDVLTIATVVLFATASLAHAVVEGSAATATAVLVVFGGSGFLAEVVGVHTGVPFGHYRYTGGPHSGGLGATLDGVPLVIALAWVMMAWPAACVAARLASRTWTRVVVAAIALAAWDVFLDPQMVDAHHWRWLGVRDHLPGVDGIPLTNFAGWLGVAVVLMAVLHGLVARTRIRDDRPMVAIWIWTWLSSTLANVAFFHRPAVAVWGFFAMGVVGVPLLASMRSLAARP